MNSNEETIVDGQLQEEETIIEVVNDEASEDTVIETVGDEETVAEAVGSGKTGAATAKSDEVRGERHGNAANAAATVVGATVGAGSAAFAPHVVSALNDDATQEGDSGRPVSNEGMSSGQDISSHSGTAATVDDIDVYEITSDDIEIVDLGDDVQIDNVSVGGEDYVVINLDSDDIIEVFPEDVSLVDDKDAIEVTVEPDDGVVDMGDDGLSEPYDFGMADGGTLDIN
ncbi:MAG: hypothetical protein IJR13_06885 [Bacteroidales bacterium]|nr:hypothetical protein [Bacteroidales bacterium]